MGPIALVWTHEMHEGGPRLYVAPPDGHADVVLASRGGELTLHVIGPTDVASRKSTVGLEQTIVVRLRPGAIPALFGIAARDLSARAAALAELWPAAASLQSRLAETTSLADRATLLTRAIDACVPTSGRTPASLAGAAVRAIRSSTEDLGIERLAAQIGWSERTLRRVFADEVGVSPRTLRAFVRLGRALDRITSSNADGAAIAAESGYFDQSHLIRDFRRFMGTTPLRLRRDWSVAPPLLRPPAL